MSTINREAAIRNLTAIISKQEGKPLIHWEQVKKMLEAMPDVPDTNVGDMISRQAAIRFIRDKVSLSLFMKRSVDKADKACMELCDMLDRELPSAQPEPHWIPMSEREPEPGNYLTTFRKRGDPEDKRDVTIDLYWSGGWDDDGIDGDGTVFETLAWMPLPKPWKGEQNDKNENS